MSSMQAAVFLGENKIELQTREIPNVKPGSVLVRVESCAICGSDLRIIRHGNERVTPPRIIGHEIAGQIVEVGLGVTKFQQGDRVSVGADIPCGNCCYCNSGKANSCDTNLAIGYQFDGGFAQYVLLDPLVVSVGPLQKIPDYLDYDLAALSEPLACCINGYEVGLMQPGRSVVIFGAGPIGTMLSSLGHIFKASQVIVVDPNAGRLENVKNFGAQHVLNPNECDVVEKVFELTNGIGADLVFTACPIVETHEQAIAMVSKGGAVNLFGGLAKSSRAITFHSNHIHYRQAYITGSHGSTPAQHAQAVDLIATQKIDVSKLISHRFHLSQLPDAVAQAASGNSMKVMIKPNA